MVGGGIALCEAVIFLTLSGSSLLDSDWPDSAETTFYMRLADEGLMTWLCAAGAMFGVGIAAVGGVRSLLQKPAERRPDDA
jgi:hypothetical protein